MEIDNGNPSATVAATTIASSSRTVVPSAEKPEKFSGANFKGWQQRAFFWLTTLGMQKFTSEEPPVPTADMPDNEKFMIVEAWKYADFLCKCYILSALEGDLYNVYSAVKTLKELWDALEKKYKIEDACLKKFVVANCYSYGKAGHKAPDCRLPKKDKKKEHANIVEKNDDIDNLYAMLSECNLVGNPKEWWIVSGATRHICAVKEAFAAYSTAGPEKELFMGNTATTKIESYGKIFLKMTSGKVLF
ncbi:uncharacterized protein [Nicotiana tomentosiformis]|uniref:uncharacterized protein n=1 Tax=Nicotiana tomentosiformis TaxID=4098 RepID=UPI00388CD272